MSEPRNRPYARVYEIEFKDGLFKSIYGLDIPIPAAERLHSSSNQTMLDNHDFIAFRTRDGRDNILVSVDSIKCIRIGDGLSVKSTVDYIRKLSENTDYHVLTALESMVEEGE